MLNKRMITNLTRKGLHLLERRAEKKANAECFGLVYEPKIPNKLKRNIAKGLACALAITGVLASSVGTYKADSYNNRSWTTYRINVANGSRTSMVYLYNTKLPEYYEWAVTSMNVSGGYGYVELSGINNDVIMRNSSGAEDTSIEPKLSQVYALKFNIHNVNVTESNPYVIFKIEMTPDVDGNRFQGYVKIIQNN